MERYLSPDRHYSPYTVCCLKATVVCRVAGYRSRKRRAQADVGPLGRAKILNERSAAFGRRRDQIKEKNGLRLRMLST